MSAVSAKKQSELTAVQLRDALDYDCETGAFRWKKDRAALARAGQIAGSPCHKKGYRFIRVNYTRFLAHRLAWLYAYGDWPGGRIDHVNGNTDDNRICNLRTVTSQQNCWNARVRSQSKTGERHISKHKNRYCVRFLRGREHVYRKSFPTMEMAVADRDRVAALLHGNFSSLAR